MDTPGHADFGGRSRTYHEMVDGRFLWWMRMKVQMPQTRFCIEKALVVQHLTTPIACSQAKSRP